MTLLIMENFLEHIFVCMYILYFLKDKFRVFLKSY